MKSATAARDLINVSTHRPRSGKPTYSYRFDFGDPVSYVVSTQVEGWCAAAGAVVDWVPSAIHVDDPEDRHAVATELGRAWSFPVFARQADSGPALRAAELARDAGTASQFVMRVFQFWYATDLPSYADILFDGLGVDCRIPADRMRAAIEPTSALPDVASPASGDTVGGPTLLTPEGDTIDFGGLTIEEPLDGLEALLRPHGLSCNRVTRPSRCYGTGEPGEPERFCRWCTCGKNAT